MNILRLIKSSKCQPKIQVQGIVSKGKRGEREKVGFMSMRKANSFVSCRVFFVHFQFFVLRIIYFIEILIKTEVEFVTIP